MFRHALPLFVVSLALLASASSKAQDKALEGEMEFGPVKIVHDVAGTSVNTPATIYLTFEEAGEGYRLQGRTFVALSALQTAAATILSDVNLPTDNCARYAPNNLVVSLRAPSVSVDKGQLLLRVNGDVAMWQCIENIVREIKI